MAEQVAAKKKRQRRVPSAAVLKITVEKIETVIKSSVDYKQIHTDSQRDGQFGYVTANLPQEVHTVLLEQSLPESKFDLAKVIKAINGL